MNKPNPDTTTAAGTPEPPAGDESKTVSPGDTSGESHSEPDGSEPRGGNPEAAKYRVRLRETEAQRDALAAQLAAAEQAVISHALATAGIDPRLWGLSKIDLDTMRTDTGALDVAAIVERAQRVRTEVYGTGPRPNPQQGIPSQRPPANSLAAAFNPNR